MIFPSIRMPIPILMIRLCWFEFVGRQLRVWSKVSFKNIFLIVDVFFFFKYRMYKCYIVCYIVFQIECMIVQVFSCSMNIRCVWTAFHVQSTGQSRSVLWLMFCLHCLSTENIWATYCQVCLVDDPFIQYNAMISIYEMFFLFCLHGKMLRVNRIQTENKSLRHVLMARSTNMVPFFFAGL